MGGRSSSGARNSLPKYSNEDGIIYTEVVRADPRYSAVASTEGIQRYHAEDLLRTVMKLEEKGETKGEIMVYDFQRDKENKQTFGQFVTAYSRALKAAGYKVTKRENYDVHQHGYVGVRGRRVYASTTKERLLHFEKI